MIMEILRIKVYLTDNIVTKGGADVFTGVESTPIADGDKFELTLKTGY